MQATTTVHTKKLKLVDRFRCNRDLEVDMASGGEQGSEKRRKRAWRKPREAIGPGEPTATPVPLKTCTSSAEHERSRQAEARQDARSRAAPDPARLDARRTSRDAAPECKSLLEIDGSMMEGGGQIIRMAMALSCLQQKPVRIVNIRAGRSNPGLQAQHLTGIQLLGRISRGKLEGDVQGSSWVTFYPGSIRGGSYLADTHTAGSVCLLLQVTFPCLLFAPEPASLVLKGGTNADMAPPIDYFVKVFKPMVERFGVRFDCDVKKKGFYPRGGGEVHVSLRPVGRLSPIVLTDRGKVTEVLVEVYRAGAVHPKVCDQMLRSAQQILRKRLGPIPIANSTFDLSEREAFSNGSGIILVAKTSTGCLFGGSANGRKNEAAEVTGRKAAEELVKNLEAGGCVDEHLQDQLVVLMALAEGRSKVRSGPLTLHTQTAIHVAQLLTEAQFSVTDDGETHIIECTGVGLRTHSS